MSLLHLPCPACHAVNRVDSDRLSDATCGKCKAALVPGRPVALSEADFERYVERSQLPVLVDFWAPWCGPCKMMAPAFEEVARTLAPEVLLAKVDTQENQSLGARMKVRSIPTMILFRGGREEGRVSGAMSAQQIVSWVRKQL